MGLAGLVLINNVRSHGWMFSAVEIALQCMDGILCGIEFLLVRILLFVAQFFIFRLSPPR